MKENVDGIIAKMNTSGVQKIAVCPYCNNKGCKSIEIANGVEMHRCAKCGRIAFYLGGDLIAGL